MSFVGIFAHQVLTITQLLLTATHGMPVHSDIFEFIIDEGSTCDPPWPSLLKQRAGEITAAT